MIFCWMPGSPERLDRPRTRHYLAPRFGRATAGTGSGRLPIGCGVPVRPLGSLWACGARAMSEKTPPDPLVQLGEKIEQARREQLRRQGKGRDTAPQSLLGIAFRIAFELVASLAVGLAIGWGTDRLLGTRPWGLIVFFFIGAAAGILNVYRTAQGLGSGTPPGQKQDRD